MLTALFFIPLIGALSLLFVNKNESLMKRITLGSTIINFVISLVIWGKFDNNTHEYQFVQEWAEISFCHFNVGIDGISLFFVLLTTFLFPIIILTSWDHKNNLKSYLLNFLILESLLIATFIVLDLLLFYIFFESILIPLFIIIINFGDLLTKEKAGFLLFLYTLFGSLFMLLSIITILILTGTTDFQILSTIDFGTDVQKLLFVGFLIAFIVKTPLIPGHIWLGFAHVAAPIGGSVLLAGVILKLATYLALRVMIPFLPDATLYFTPLIYTLAVISIIYASLTCLRLIDVKAIIAYSSVSHMGVVVLGLFSNNLQGIEGAVILGLAHGVISPLLFIIVGDILYTRSHTRIIKYYRGIATSMPILSLIFFFATLANIATPFSGNFIGEFMSFAGAFQQNPIMAILGATGIFLGTGYSIWLFNRMSFGAASRYMSTMPDINRREFFVLLPLIIVSFILGIYPNIVLDSLHLGISSLLINSPQNILLCFCPGLILCSNKTKDGSLHNPIYTYENIIESRSQIQKDLKGKSGIYQFINKNEPTKTYIGSSINLWERIRYHIRTGSNTNYTYVSLLYRGIEKYSWNGFKLVIIEFTTNNKKVLLEKEQFYLDLFKPYYNILTEAGSPAGRTLSIETRAKISAAHKREEGSGMFGKTHSDETKNLMSLARQAENHPLWGKNLSDETKLKMSIAKGTTIYVYSPDKSTLINTFISARKAAEFFNTNHRIILKHAKNGLLFKEQWIFSTIQLPTV
jgi:NADH-ubiquinone oxidoreductase chain 4